MTIIHYIPSIDRTSGGTSTYIQLLAKELGKLVELHIVTHNSDNPVKMENCTVHYISNSIFGSMKTEWLQLLKELKPDVVHINCCWIPQCAIVQKWTQQLGIKIALTPHGMLEPWIMARHHYTRKLPALWLYQAHAIRKADYLHATAESERDNLLKLGYNEHIAVISNGIDVKGIKIKDTWERQKQILFLSRVHVKKGIEILIDAVADLRKELNGYKIIIAGEGEPEYIEQLKNRITEYGLEKMVKLAGGIYGEDKWKLYRNSDLFVLPTYSENFGLAVAEALASGTPVITTKGTPWSDLETNYCGWWTDVGTQPTMDALRQFLAQDEETLEKMGRNGRKLIEDKYSACQMAESMELLYKEII